MGAQNPVRSRHTSIPPTRIYPPTRTRYFHPHIHPRNCGTNWFFLGPLWTKRELLNAKKTLSRKRMELPETFQDVLGTERVGFEPTRVLPLHDFESCAINRTLPPLHTPSGVPAV